VRSSQTAQLPQGTFVGTAEQLSHPVRRTPQPAAPGWTPETWRTASVLKVEVVAVNWTLGRWRALTRERGILGAGAHVAHTLTRQITGYVYYRTIRPLGLFTFRGAVYPYLVHWHNLTWENERSVEVPIAWRAVRQAQARGMRVLEVGNVLSHYHRVQHDVLDKYEHAPGIIRADVLDFRSPHRYDFIVSISTLEHVGWDDEPRDAAKAELAIRHLRALLAPNGWLLATIPIGQNPHLDRLLSDGPAPFERISFLRREPRRNHWVEGSAADVSGARPWQETRSATVIAIGWAGPIF
jgi:SAM-dependent methyltransferase